MPGDDAGVTGWLRALVSGLLRDAPAGPAEYGTRAGKTHGDRVAATDGGSDGGVDVGAGSGDGPDADRTWAGDDPITFDESADADGAALLEAVTDPDPPTGEAPTAAFDSASDGEALADLGARIDGLEAEQEALEESVGHVREDVAEVRTALEGIRADVDRLVGLATGIAAAEGAGVSFDAAPPGDVPESRDRAGADVRDETGDPVYPDEPDDSASPDGSDDPEEQIDPDAPEGRDAPEEPGDPIAPDGPDGPDELDGVDGPDPVSGQAPAADEGPSGPATDQAVEDAAGLPSDESGEHPEWDSGSDGQIPDELPPVEWAGQPRDRDRADDPTRDQSIDPDGGRTEDPNGGRAADPNNGRADDAEDAVDGLAPENEGSGTTGADGTGVESDRSVDDGDDRSGEVRGLVDPTSDAVGARLRRYREDIGGEVGAVEGTGFEFRNVLWPADDGGLPEVADDDLSRPYLESLPGGYAAETAVIEWLDWLVSETDRETAARTIDYYATVEWLGEAVADELVDYLQGIGPDDRPEGTPEAPESMDLEAHLRSLRYVTALASGEVAADGV